MHKTSYILTIILLYSCTLYILPPPPFFFDPLSYYYLLVNFGKFYDNSTTVLHNVGFSKSGIHNYVRKYFAANAKILNMRNHTALIATSIIKDTPSTSSSSSSFIHNILQLFQRCPILYGILSIPLNLHSFCFMKFTDDVNSSDNNNTHELSFLQKNGSITLTLLYDQFLKVSINNYVKRKQKNNAQNNNNNSAMVSLHAFSNAVMKFLSNLAHETLMNQKNIYFSIDTIQSVFSSSISLKKFLKNEENVSEFLIDCGLIQATGDYKHSVLASNIEFYFSHLTYQEYLAAYWIIQYYKSDKQIKRLFGRLLKDWKKYNMVLNFTMGMYPRSRFVLVVDGFISSFLKRIFGTYLFPQTDNPEIQFQLLYEAVFSNDRSNLFNKQLINHFNSNTKMERVTISSKSTYLNHCICSCLEISTVIRRLHMSRTYFQDNNAITLSSALKRNSTLLYLDLSRNTVTNKGVECLAAALKVSSSLRELSLKGQLSVLNV